MTGPAPFGPQELCLCYALDALGHDDHAQGWAKPNHGSNDGLITGVGWQVLDELPIYVDDVYGKALQMRQRRVPCSEVVQGGRHASGTQRPEGFLGRGVSAF